MFSYIKKRKIKIFFIVTILFSIFFINYNKEKKGTDSVFGNMIFSISLPSRKISTLFRNSFISSIQRYLLSEELEEENIKLKKQLEKYKLDAIEHEKLKLTSKNLFSHFEFEQNTNDDIILVEIIGELTNNYSKILVVNKGKSSGILKNQALINSSGVLGKVIKVQKNVAYVQIITDIRSHLPVIIQRTRSKGIMVGKGGNDLILRFIPLNSGIKKNDLIVASGLAGIFPKDFPVGKVKSFKHNRYYHSVEAIVEPLANFSRVEFAFVVIKAKNNTTAPLFQD